MTAAIDLAVANNDTSTGTIHRQRADGTFAGPPTGAAGQAREVVAADLDGDGDLDLATHSNNGLTDVVRLALNDGTGTMTDAGFVRWEDFASREGRGLVAADLDGDGDQDLTWIASSFDAQRIVLARNNGNATFATPTARKVDGVCATRMAVGDVDGDGDLDQVFPDEFGCGSGADPQSYVTISYNDGTGSFSGDTRVRMSALVRAVEVLDANGDGHADLFGAGVGSGSGATGDAAISFGDGTGAFPAGTLVSSGNAHVELAAIDFEGDGDVDVATDSRQVRVRRCSPTTATAGSPRSTLPGNYLHGYTNAIGVAAGDVTGDSIVDIVVAHATGSDVGVHAGNGDGTFQERQVRYGLRPRVADVKLADLTGDGLLDVITPATQGGGGLDGTDTADTDRHHDRHGDRAPRPGEPPSSVHDHRDAGQRRPPGHTRRRT